VAAADGDLVIDGRIRAWLLRLPLLDLDVHVVVGSARSRPALSHESRPPAPPRDTGTRASATPSAPRRAPDLSGAADGSPTLGRAVRLLGEGSTALDDARRIRGDAIVDEPDGT
jgi:hypothetical protein